MNITLGKYEFQGPLDGARFLYEKPGVFVILCRDIRDEGKFYVIDIDQAKMVRSAAMEHDRQVEWVKACHGTGKLALGVYYAEKMTEEERKGVVGYIRGLYTIPCGN
jgi:hypothetical protein